MPRLKAKEKRELQKKNMANRYAKENISVIGTVTKADEVPDEPELDESKEIIKTKASTAKKAGVKSTFVLDGNKLLMTSFGRGNEAILEKRIDNEEITDLNNKPQFELGKGSLVNEYSVVGRNRKEGTAVNPNHKNTENDRYQKMPGEDNIGIKGYLEKTIFDNCEDCKDNIHVQIAYNILDIEKILSPCVNNVVHCIANVTRKNKMSEALDLGMDIHEDNPYDALVKPEKYFDEDKTARVTSSYEKFISLISSPRRRYFGEALYDPSEHNEKKWIDTEDDLKRYYYELYILSMLRQSLFHGEVSDSADIYKIDERFDGDYQAKPTRVKARKEAREQLDIIYKKRVDKLNNNFIKMASEKDLPLLFEIYHADKKEEKEKIVKEYYNFVVRKEYKNSGLSIKKLREKILYASEGVLSKDGETIRSAVEHSAWSKFVKLFNFVIDKYYNEHQEELRNVVEELRGDSTDEEKDNTYRIEADRLWQIIREHIMNTVVPNLNESAIKEIKAEKGIDKNILSNIGISGDSNYFCKMIFVLCMFLDGKEINDLLTQLINKFDNISSFNDVMDAYNIKYKYSKDYSIFNDSKRIRIELGVVKNLACMLENDKDKDKKKKGDKTIPEKNGIERVMYLEAARALGVSCDNEELNEYISLIITTDEEDIKAIKERLKYDFKRFPMPKKGFRNFVINNVIKSKRFRYLARYINPKDFELIAKNEKIVKFVLKEIPEKQIARYYQSCLEPGISIDNIKPSDYEMMRNQLAKTISRLKFTDFTSVDQSSNALENEDKSKALNLIGLYLTIPYLFVKNLIYVNARYSMAFHSFERDHKIITGKKFNKHKLTYDVITKKFIEEKRINSRASKYIQTNMEKSNAFCIHKYRVCVAHLLVLDNITKYINDIDTIDSYFSAYHYIAQRFICDQYYSEEGTEYRDANSDAFFESIKKYHCYRKDFVKALNIPFGYNLPRYKNLSICELFDRNNMGKQIPLQQCAD